MAGTFKKTLITLVVLIVGLFVVGMFYGSSIVTSAVEEYGPEYTRTTVTLEDVSFSPIGGDLGLSGLVIGSPGGFDAEKIFSLGEVSISLDPVSLFSDVVHIKELRITDPEMVVEIKNGKLNYKALMDNLSSYVPEDEEDEDVRVVIDDLYITGAKVTLMGLPVGDEGQVYTLGDIHLKDIGKNENGEAGATFLEATQDVVGAVTVAVTKLVAEKKLNSLLEGGKKSLKDKIKNFFGGGEEDEGEEDDK